MTLKNKIKIGFIGCVESSAVGLNSLLSNNNADYQVVGVVTKKFSSFNSDFVDLSSICIEHSVPYLYAGENKSNTVEDFMQKLQPDIIFCVGWSYLLNSDLLNIPKYGVLGFHPADLPANRGRHPIIWAIALGLKSTSSTFFKMDLGADTGPIVNQVKIKIKSHYNARNLYDEILNTVSCQVTQIAEDMVAGKLNFVDQDHSKSNVWRKRGINDGVIDFRMTAEDIHNLVRALSSPYPGADVKIESDVYKIWKSELISSRYPKNIEPGSILEIDEDRLLVKAAGMSALYIWNKELGEKLIVGDYI
jgi:methionyl-tRNA formyltransferase